eukprot:CAMPEP_0115858952 /NCGR_PEP_ID=MMETSP0287-20121206/16362_1 /TAXON_ID=412157 /ORGANISM="Chrysochromulina rotalis, Strain UIO044" /LENGTH=165 /DNA_ID=CAMNT_0003313231 /DNA_START=714 /DNA_END=1211 /DNA_ORIENTATION=+
MRGLPAGTDVPSSMPNALGVTMFFSIAKGVRVASANMCFMYSFTTSLRPKEAMPTSMPLACASCTKLRKRSASHVSDIQRFSTSATSTPSPNACTRSTVMSKSQTIICGFAESQDATSTCTSVAAEAGELAHDAPPWASSAASTGAWRVGRGNAQVLALVGSMYW